MIWLLIIEAVVVIALALLLMAELRKSQRVARAGADSESKYRETKADLDRALAALVGRDERDERDRKDQRRADLERAVAAIKRESYFETAVVTAERPVWTQEDAELFRLWLATPVGRKVGGILRFDEQKQNRSAVLRVSGHEYNSGFAAGFHARSQSLLELSADVRPQQDEDSGAHEGAADPAERLAP